MKIEKKISERRPLVQSKEESAPEATLVGQLSENDSKKAAEFKVRQKEARRISFPKKKGSTETDLKKILDDEAAKS